jgi:ubiquinone/menaquinone biosynthesis C-methylase UbiE
MHLNEAVHAMWDGVAPGWAAHASYVEARAAGLTAALLDRLALEPGARVLELASGPGDTGIAAARRVGPSGEVVISDVAPAMVAVAADRVAASGLGNVTTRRLDLEAIDEPDASFDAVVVREGLMFAVEPRRAAAELRRVLRPGGRLAVAVWGPRERNPWLGLVLDGVSAETGFPVPPPGVPGPFSLSDAAGLDDVLTAAGFGAVAIEEHAIATEAASFDEWWSRTTALAGPLAGVIAGLPAAARAAVVDRVRTSVAPYRTETGGLALPGVSLVASGRAVTCGG